MNFPVCVCVCACAHARTHMYNKQFNHLICKYSSWNSMNRMLHWKQNAFFEVTCFLEGTGWQYCEPYQISINSTTLLYSQKSSRMLWGRVENWYTLKIFRTYLLWVRLSGDRAPAVCLTAPRTMRYVKLRIQSVQAKNSTVLTNI
jgi:hypothetical protein